MGWFIVVPQPISIFDVKLISGMLIPGVEFSESHPDPGTASENCCSCSNSGLTESTTGEVRNRLVLFLRQIYEQYGQRSLLVPTCSSSHAPCLNCSS